MSKNEQKAKAGVNPRRKAGFRLFLLTTPILIGIFIFSYLPLLGWIYAFFDYKPGLSIWDCTFTGLKWFTMPFANSVLRGQFGRVMANTLGINFLYLIAMILPMFCDFPDGNPLQTVSEGGADADNHTEFYQLGPCLFRILFPPFHRRTSE